MPILHRLFRNTPGPDLKSYFDARGIVLPEPVNWNGEHAALVEALPRSVEKLTEAERERLRTDAERVDQMASEVAQSAILAVVTPSQRETLRDIETPHARALWLFLNDLRGFERAEYASFFDNARLGKRLWDAFVAGPGLSVNRAPDKLAAFAAQIRSFFVEGKRVRVEVFDRTRPDADGNRHPLLQVTVWREGLPAGQTVFEGDGVDLGLLIFRPVCELAFTYEPTEGVIEVVAQQKEKREELVRLFADTLLDQKIEGKRIPLRHYDLSVFMDERVFPTDPQDGIDAVRLRVVKFEPTDGGGYVTLETRSETETVQALGRRLFGEYSPFTADGFQIREVILAVRFRPDRINPRGKTVTVKLRHPNGCDLKEKTDKERKLGETYLKRWGILTEISYG